MPVEVKGALAVRKALRQFEPDLAKETTKEIGGFLKTITSKAKGYVPSNDAIPSNWLKKEGATGRWADRAYDAQEVKRGITFKSSPSKADRRGFRSVATVFNKTPAGTIYEWAGRTSGNVGNFTPRLNGEIKGNKKGMRGRVLFRAYQEDQGKARAGILKAVEKASAKLNAKVGK